MATNYFLRVYDRTGNLLRQVADFRSFYLDRWVNHPDLLRVVLPVDHPIFEDLKEDTPDPNGLTRDQIIELWRRDTATGVNTYFQEFEGYYLAQKAHIPDPIKNPNMAPYREITCLGFEYLLQLRHVAFTADVSNRSLFTAQKPEYIAKQLVYNNLGQGANVAPRIRENSRWYGVTVAQNLGTGTPIDFVCPYENLHTALLRLHDISGGDFELRRTRDSATNDPTHVYDDVLTFDWREGQLGQDLTGSIVLSVDHGTMVNPVYTWDRTNYRNAAILAGMGQGTARTAYGWSPTTLTPYEQLHYREIFVNASDLNDDTALMATRAAQELAKWKKVETFTFNIGTTEALQYRRDINLGDRVSALNPFTGATVDVKVNRVTITLAPGGEESLELQTEVLTDE